MIIGLNGNNNSDGENSVARLERAEKTSTTKEVGWPLFPQAITPDTPVPILTEISKSPRLLRFKEELIRGAQARQALMILRQQRLNEANARIEHRIREGFGQKIASIDMELYFKTMQEHGQDCWQQPDFMDKFLRDNPECRIHTNFPTRFGNGTGTVPSTRRGSGFPDSQPTRSAPPS
jgi:hypothetical protein